MINNQIQIPFTFSQSSLQDYSDCEKRFFLRYVRELSWPSVDSEPILENEFRQIEGQRFHQLIHRYFQGIPAAKLDKMANSPPLNEWWQNFKHTNFNLDEFDLQPEQTLISNLGKNWLTAKYDLIATNSKQIRIYDWKTYQKRPSVDLLLLRYQTRVYLSLLSKSIPSLYKERSYSPENIEMIYWLANFPDQPINIPYNKMKFNRDWRHLTRLVDRIESQDEFPMTDDDKKCRFCTYRSYCDRGISAGEWSEEEEVGLTGQDFNWEDIDEIEF